MGALCSGPTPELSVEAELDAFESGGTGALKSLDEALSGLRTGDLVFLRRGNRSSDDSAWLSGGVAFYIPTKAYEEPLLLERRPDYDDMLEDELSRKVVDSGLRLVNLRQLLLRLPPGHFVYVRHLRAPTTFTSTRETPRETQDAYLLSVARVLNRDSSEGLAPVQFLETAKLLPAKLVDRVGTLDLLSRENIPLVEDFEYSELARFY
jgi:hypothetical protein